MDKQEKKIKCRVRFLIYWLLIIIILQSFALFHISHKKHLMQFMQDWNFSHWNIQEMHHDKMNHHENQKWEEKSSATLSNQEIAIAGFDAIFKDFNTEAVEKYFTEDYIQHNLNVPTGRDVILGLVDGLKQAGTTVETKRVITDGDLVVFHNEYNNAQMFGAEKMVSFDVFRIEDGKIAEHWDNLTPVVEETASGRSQIDGETDITDVDKTEENRALVQGFVDDILLGGQQNFTDYISTETYLQHNPMVADGLDGFGQAVEYLVSQDDMFHYTKVHKIMAEGNFILTISEGERHGKAQAFYDLFRVENGKIVEHWDIIAEIPTEAANENGKFNFPTDNQEVIETATVQLLEGVSLEEFKKADQKVEDEFVSQQPGFISRNSEMIDGVWTVTIHWESEADSQNSMKNFASSEAAVDFMSMIDPSTMSMEITPAE